MSPKISRGFEILLAERDRLSDELVGERGLKGALIVKGRMMENELAALRAFADAAGPLLRYWKELVAIRPVSSKLTGELDAALALLPKGTP